MKIAIFRPEAEAAESMRLCSEAGLEPVAFRLMETVPLRFDSDALLSALIGARIAVFMSCTAVCILLDSLPESKTELMGKDAVAVGSSTAACLLGKGIHSHIPPEFSSRGLAAYMTQKWKPCDVAVFRSARGNSLLRDHLEKASFRVQEFALYDIRKNPDSDVGRLLDMIRSGQRLILPFTSSMMALFFIEEMRASSMDWSMLKGCCIWAIGPETAETLRKGGAEAVRTASVSDFRIMLAEIKGALASSGDLFP